MAEVTQLELRVINSLQMICSHLKLKSGAMHKALPPFSCDNGELVEAARWASKAWRAFFVALTCRDSDSRTHHELVDEEGILIARSLTLRFLKDPIMAVKYVKDQSCYLAAKIFNQPDDQLPIFKDPELSPSSDEEEERRRKAKRGILGGGWVYRRCRRLMSFHIGNCNSVAACLRHGVDILMSKTGRGRVPDALVAKTRDEHFVALTTARERTPEMRGRIEQVKVRITEMIEHMFKNRTYDPKIYIPSFNACAQASRGDGGSMGALLKDWADCLVIMHDTGRDSKESPPVIVKASVCDQGIQEYRSIPVKGLDLLPSFFQYVEHYLRLIVKEGFVNAHSLPIVEPDKVRMITKMDAYAAYATLSLQKFMHTIIKSYPVFEYIGHPIDQESWARHFGTVPEMRNWVSGDYSAATDNLDPEVSNFVWSEICRVSLYEGGTLKDSLWEQIGKLSLTGHLLHKGMLKGEKGEQEKAPQMWGQLMGSPMSFPILCLVNAAASSLGFDVSVQKLLVDPGPLVVNGDDLAAVETKDGQLQNWSELVSAVGLKPSLGKNYVSPDFLIMNSELRMYRKGTWRKIGFMNQALLYSTERKGPEAGCDLRPKMGWWDLGDRAREMIEDIPQATADRWLDMFLVYHADLIRQMPPGTSKFACKALGGAGIPLYKGYKPSKDERRTAALIACNSEEYRQLKGCRIVFPKTRTRSWLDTQMFECETYYSKYLPVIESERPTMDLVLENWGFPIQREKSSLGCAVRLAWILQAYLGISGEPGEPGRSEECLERFESKKIALAGVLQGIAIKAKKLVASHEKRRLFDSYFCWDCTHPLHLMSVEKMTRWTCPTEDLIQWGMFDLHGSGIRFDEETDDHVQEIQGLSYLMEVNRLGNLGQYHKIPTRLTEPRLKQKRSSKPLSRIYPEKAELSNLIGHCADHLIPLGQCIVNLQDEYSVVDCAPGL